MMDRTWVTELTRETSPSLCYSFKLKINKQNKRNMDLVVTLQIEVFAFRIMGLNWECKESRIREITAMTLDMTEISV